MNTTATSLTSEEPTYVAPRNNTERQLAAVWEEAFEHTPIGITEDFFALGGDSMLAVAIFEKLEKTFDCKLPLATLMDHPTIGQLALLIGSQSEEPVSWTALVPIQTQGKKTPFFAVHAEGNVLFYKTLADTLGPSRPFYALQTLELDGTRAPFDDIPLMARHYLSEIRGVQPTGPYIISGMCFGAWIALEMAQQLIAVGETVDALIVFDSGGPELRKSTVEIDPDARSDKPLVQKIVTHMRNGQLLKVASHFLIAKRQKFREKKARAAMSPMRKRIYDARMENKRIREEYKAEKYPGKLHFFRSDQYHRKPSKLGQLSQWNEIFEQGVESYLISTADHTTILSPPSVYEVADRINAILENAPANNSVEDTVRRQGISEFQEPVGLRES